MKYLTVSDWIPQLAETLLKENPEVPTQEQWLYNNTEALSSVLSGLKDSSNGKVMERSYK